MKYCSRKEPWVDKGDESTRVILVFLWWPQFIKGCWHWLELAERHERSWGWGFHDVSYKAIKKSER